MVFSASYCVEHEDKVDDYAINLFINYLFYKPADKVSQKINQLLSTKFYIDEKSPGESVSKTLKVCERILNSKIQNISGKQVQNLDFEWVNYYAGLAYYLKKEFKKAISNLNQARESKIARPVSKYWLGMAMLEQLMADRKTSLQVEASRYHALMEIFRDFIEMASEDPDIISKKMTAKHKLGVLIVRWILDQLKQKGFGISTEINNLLNQAISFLETSVKEKVKDVDSAFFYLGRACSLLKNHQQAVLYYQQALADLPSDDMLHYFLGQENFILQNYEAVYGNLTKCLELNPGNLEARKNILKVSVLLKLYPEAERHFAKLSDQNSVDQDSRYNYVISLYHQQKYSKLVKFVESELSAVAVEDLPEEVVFFTGKAYIILKSYEQARKYFKSLTGKTEYQYYHCFLLSKLDLYQEAETIISGMTAVIPEFQYRIKMLAGEIYSKQGKYDQAKASYMDLYVQHPDDPGLNLALGCLYMNTGNPEDAVSHFLRVLSVNDGDFTATAGLAMCYEKLKNFREALNYYTLAFKIKEESWINTRIGILYVLMEDYETARVHLGRLSELNPDDDSVMFYLGLAHIRLNDFDKALEIWERLLKKTPGNRQLQQNISEARYNNGIRFINLKEYDQAILEWEEYFKFHTKDNGLKKELAQLYFTSGLSKLEIQNTRDLKLIKKNYFDKAYELDKTNPTYLFYLALLEFVQKNHNIARDMLEELCEKIPGNLKYRYYLSLVLLETGEKDRSLRLLSEICETPEKNGYSENARLIIANEHIKNQQYDEAITLLKEQV
jgi:tetratricopeptide (TPR) repeat protein